MFYGKYHGIDFNNVFCFPGSFDKIEGGEIHLSVFRLNSTNILHVGAKNSAAFQRNIARGTCIYSLQYECKVQAPTLLHRYFWTCILETFFPGITNLRYLVSEMYQTSIGQISTK